MPRRNVSNQVAESGDVSHKRFFLNCVVCAVVVTGVLFGIFIGVLASDRMAFQVLTTALAYTVQTLGILIAVFGVLLTVLSLNKADGRAKVVVGSVLMLFGATAVLSSPWPVMGIIPLSCLLLYADLYRKVPDRAVSDSPEDVSVANAEP